LSQDQCFYTIVLQEFDVGAVLVNSRDFYNDELTFFWPLITIKSAMELLLVIVVFLLVLS
jgi:hypothetical protein